VYAVIGFLAFDFLLMIMEELPVRLARFFTQDAMDAAVWCFKLWRIMTYKFVILFLARRDHTMK
jgi:hypothetical protein